jgi:DNA-binding MarR family transcriptional regulator
MLNNKESRSIRVALYRYGIEMKEIAKELDMTCSNVSSVLRGKSRNDTVIKLAKEKIKAKKEFERNSKVLTV